jgi:hypothetical protein
VTTSKAIELLAGGQQDYTLRQPQEPTYTYWPVAYNYGDPTVISQTPLPLSGVQFSKGMRMAGQLKGSLQLADPRVRAINPWALVTPRKTGIVVIRSVTDPVSRVTTSQAVDHFAVISAPRDPATGRMNITANSVEGVWAERLITGSQMVTIIPGWTYTFSTQYSSGAAFDVVMQVNWLDVNGTLLGSTAQDMGTIPGPLTVLSSNHTAPAGAAQAQAIIYANAVPATSGFNIGQPSFVVLGITDNYIGNSALANSTAGWSAASASTTLLAEPGYMAVVSGSSGAITGAVSAPMVNGTGSVALSWSQADQQQIAADLLNPDLFSQIARAPSPWPGWINVTPPSVPTNVLRDLTYALNSQTNLLTAHQDRSNVINGYEWTTSLVVLFGSDPLSANSYRIQFDLGYPRLGAQLLNGDEVPRFAYKVDGSGNTIDYDYEYDGTGVMNIEWGNGAGYDSATVQALSTNSTDWQYGFLQSEGQYSNPDVSVQQTLQDYTDSQIVQALAGEQYLKGLTVRGDLPPYFGTYGIGDDMVFEADDWTWPDNPDGSRGVELATRIMGWTVTPPEGSNSEQVALVVSGGDVGSV